MTKSFVFTIVIIISLVLFFYNIFQFLKTLKIGKPENRFNQPLKRLKLVLSVAFGQSKILREPIPGIAHFLIFWGFIILLTAIIETLGEGLFPHFSLSFLGDFYPILATLQEVLILGVVIGVFIGLYRRLISKPKRLDLGKGSMIDASIILGIILFIIIGTLGQTASRIAASHPEDGRFLSNAIAPLIANVGNPELIGEFFWWMHIFLVLGFLNYLPYSKHFHIITSIPNVFFSDINPKGALKPINLEAENGEKFGVSDVVDMTWKQLFDGYTCTECGRCMASCPANFTGKSLSPRKIIMDTRVRLKEKAPYLIGQKKFAYKLKEGDKKSEEKTLLNDYITAEELYACTTCVTCMRECPVNIEHVGTIVDLRRSLVLMESNFPQEVQVVFKNLENNFSPWAFPPSARADWAEGMSIPIISNNPEFEILFWIGCAGAFDARYVKVTQAIVRLFKKAGIKFAILGTEEKCTGDSARRIGNEYLAQILMKENIETLNRYNVRKIVTACPHCFNTLKNEYPQFGGNYKVVHHSEFLIQLIKEGKLKITNKVDEEIVYHDSCYLGRYNNIYDEPREVLEEVGLDIKEMKRSFSRGFCCGAGGGRMWMEEKVGKRINVERTEEALTMYTNRIATACPFCMTMLEDGLKEKGKSDDVKVMDIAEVLEEAVE